MGRGSVRVLEWVGYYVIREYMRSEGHRGIGWLFAAVL